MNKSSYVLIVEANFYKDITSELVAGAVEELDEHGVNHKIISVPGALEIPLAIKMAMSDEEIKGVVALGCVIRGETTHYDYVCAESTRGVNNLAIEFSLPVGYGVLTVENSDQAKVRASREKGNKGAAAARACMQMIAVKEQFSKEKS
tara:strand:- start:21624 stop:22067 length:444 start_codon:yes stop_codon:yes gene_type:complete